MTKPTVAFIGTGGTIASLGRGPLDLQDYGAAGNVRHAEEIVAKWPIVHQVADVIAVKYRNIPSTAIDFADWKALLALCHQLPRDHPNRDAGGDSVFPQSDIEDPSSGRAGRRATALERSVVRRGNEPRQRHPCRG